MGNKHNKKKKGNYISAEVYIKEEDTYKYTRIINSFEKAKSEEKWINTENDNKYENEEEIKKCKIKINDELIPFCYCYKFSKKGKNIIKYLFSNELTKMNHMFIGCSSLINIDLSNYNTKNAINMSYMFSGCSSLKNIDLSSINTQNVTDMSCMFNGCISLKNINLSNLNTQNVTDMNGMFSGCNSLTNINLSNFNTQKVLNMSFMFSECKSLNKY